MNEDQEKTIDELIATLESGLACLDELAALDEAEERYLAEIDEMERSLKEAIDFGTRESLQYVADRVREIVEQLEGEQGDEM